MTAARAESYGARGFRSGAGLGGHARAVRGAVEAACQPACMPAAARGEGVAGWHGSGDGKRRREPGLGGGRAGGRQLMAGGRRGGGSSQRATDTSIFAGSTLHRYTAVSSAVVTEIQVLRNPGTVGS
eukprot:SAG31_NODE_1195_length_9445_cov_21.712711_11_plen_127_part_00